MSRPRIATASLAGPSICSPYQASHRITKPCRPRRTNLPRQTALASPRRACQTPPVLAYVNRAAPSYDHPWPRVASRAIPHAAGIDMPIPASLRVASPARQCITPLTPPCQSKGCLATPSPHPAPYRPDPTRPLRRRAVALPPPRLPSQTRRTISMTCLTPVDPVTPRLTGLATPREAVAYPNPPYLTGQANPR